MSMSIANELNDLVKPHLLESARLEGEMERMRTRFDHWLTEPDCDCFQDCEIALICDLAHSGQRLAKNNRALRRMLTCIHQRLTGLTMG
jgi:hypothetical protein